MTSDGDNANGILAPFLVEEGEDDGISKLRKTLRSHNITLWTNSEEYDFNIVCDFGTIIISSHMEEFEEKDNFLFLKEILRMLEEGGHVCILYDDMCPDFHLITELLSANSIDMIKLEKSYVEYDLLRSEFYSFLRKYGIISLIFETNKKITSVICTMMVSFNRGIEQNNKSIAGFTVQKGKGWLTLLPIKTEYTLYSDELQDILFKFSKALDTHRKNILSYAPEWLSDIKLFKEEDLFLFALTGYIGQLLIRFLEISLFSNGLENKVQDRV